MLYLNPTGISGQKKSCWLLEIATSKIKTKMPGVYGALGYFVMGSVGSPRRSSAPDCPTRSISRHRIPADALTRFDVRFGAGNPIPFWKGPLRPCDGSNRSCSGCAWNRTTSVLSSNNTGSYPVSPNAFRLRATSHIVRDSYK